MYGRETPVGYQKSTFTGRLSPADCRSCFALFGLYGYFGTLFVQPKICGGRDSCATTARAKEKDRTTDARASPYAPACRTPRSSNGAWAWLIVTYATLNGGRFSVFSFESLLIEPMSCGATRSYPWISPVFNAWSRVSLLAIGRMMIRWSFAFLPQ